MAHVLTGQALVDACYMWCLHRGLKPYGGRGTNFEALLWKATHDNRRPFDKLNETQRRSIAGLMPE